MRLKHLLARSNNMLEVRGTQTASREPTALISSWVARQRLLLWHPMEVFIVGPPAEEVELT